MKETLLIASLLKMTARKITGRGSRRSFRFISSVAALVLIAAFGFPSSVSAQEATQNSAPSVSAVLSSSPTRVDQAEAERVIQYLQGHPEALIQLKSAIEAYAAKRGKPISSADLADQAIFDRLRSDPDSLALAEAELKLGNQGESPAKAPSATSLQGDQRVPAMPAQNAPMAPAQNPPEKSAAPTATRESAVPPQQAPVPADIKRSIRNPYPDIPPLNRFYQQVTPSTGELPRFGMSIFRTGTGNFDALPMDLPVGPEYVVGPGDLLGIQLSGAVSTRDERMVDRRGVLLLPEVGELNVSGKTLAQAQSAAQNAIDQRLKGTRVSLTLGRVRTIRVYVVGDVERPGAYDISSLATPLNALYAAGGPTDIGSMRVVRQYRGANLVQEVDLYDLLLKGVGTSLQRLEAGDTLLVPPQGPTITLEGMVRRPAVYELKNEQSLAQALAMAGGVLPTGTLRHIEVQRIIAHERRTMFSLDLPDTEDGTGKAVQDFKIGDGDVVQITPILPTTDQTVYVVGHVFRPGKYAFKQGMRASDLFKGNAIMLPEVASYAEIQRISPPQYRPEVLSFRLDDKGVVTGDDPLLMPFDTVRIYSRYEFEDVGSVTVDGEVRQPGQYRLNGEVRLVSAIQLAGGTTLDARLDIVQVYRILPDSSSQVFNLDLSKALTGDMKENIVLQNRDRVQVNKNIAKIDPDRVWIQGDVATPGQYPFSKGMKATDLVKMAGGARKSAYLSTADLMHYYVEGNSRVVTEPRTVEIGKALSGDASADMELSTGDVLTIRQITGWNDIGASVSVTGEVAHGGSFGIRDGERLSSVLKRAGGFKSLAYAHGLILERQDVKVLAAKAREDFLTQLQTQQYMAPKNPSTGQTNLVDLEQVEKQRQHLIDVLRAQPVSGRIAVSIGPDIKRWENTSADIELRAGDVITVPKRPSSVAVQGQVYGSTSIAFTPHRNVAWYIQRAGGMTEYANKKNIFVVCADGKVIGHSSGFWGSDVMDYRPQPGDMIIVPEKILGTDQRWAHFGAIAQFLTGTALAGAVLANSL